MLRHGDYDPRTQSARRDLAERMLIALDKAKFEEEDQGQRVHERVFSRVVVDEGKEHGDIRIVVYTGIVDRECRAVAKDSIKVCGLYRTKDGERDRGIIKTVRVHRTGKPEAIVERMLERMRDVWRRARTAPRCKDCGAPTFRSKKGNDVCSDLCWKTRPRSPESRNGNGDKPLPPPDMGPCPM